MTEVGVAVTIVVVTEVGVVAEIDFALACLTIAKSPNEQC